MKKLTTFRIITVTNSNAGLQFLVGNIRKNSCSWCVDSPPRLIGDATLPCKVKHFLNSCKTPQQNKQKKYRKQSC